MDDIGKSPLLEGIVDKTESDMKLWLVNYVGEKTSPNNGEVRVKNIVEVMSEEFPEFLMAIAEENWIRGYHQALNDVEYGEQLLKQQQEGNEQKQLNKVDSKISQPPSE